MKNTNIVQPSSPAHIAGCLVEVIVSDIMYTTPDKEVSEERAVWLATFLESAIEVSQRAGELFRIARALRTTASTPGAERDEAINAGVDILTVIIRDGVAPALAIRSASNLR